MSLELTDIKIVFVRDMFPLDIECCALKDAPDDIKEKILEVLTKKDE